MRLGELLKDIYDGEIQAPYRQWDIPSISSDSRKVQKDSLFIALNGSTFNGADFIDEAIDKGAKVIVMGREKRAKALRSDICYLHVHDTDQFLREICKHFYGNPSQNIRTIGITGTNGKTTVTYLVESVLSQADRSCSVIGSVNYRIGSKTLPSQNTTPGFLDNQQFLFHLVDEGVQYCVMEVSSHALDQGRVDGIDFNRAVFTNLTSDHLDYHQTKDDYFAAKTQLFTNLAAGECAILNLDDVCGQELVSMTESKVMTYGIENNANVMAEDIELSLSGLQFTLISPKGKVNMQSRLIGRHNIYNILAAVSVGMSENIPLEQIKLGIECVEVIPGRLEQIKCGQDFFVFIDYAHTQDALENVLNSIKPGCDQKIILVIGCGGDRDKTKRPLMGEVAGKLADFTIVTADNPRSEDPQAIIGQIAQGIKNDRFEIIEDRKQAIGKALALAQAGDVVLIAGKGHETYQIFKDKTIDFDERKIIKEFLK